MGALRSLFPIWIFINLLFAIVLGFALMDNDERVVHWLVFGVVSAGIGGALSVAEIRRSRVVFIELLTLCVYIFLCFAGW